MRVAYWQRDPRDAGEPDAARRSDLERLLETIATSSSLHVPLNDQTRHMIDAAALARIEADRLSREHRARACRG